MVLIFQTSYLPNVYQFVIQRRRQKKQNFSTNQLRVCVRTKELFWDLFQPDNGVMQVSHRSPRNVVLVPPKLAKTITISSCCAPFRIHKSVETMRAVFFFISEFRNFCFQVWPIFIWWWETIKLGLWVGAPHGRGIKLFPGHEMHR
jgi:hypothetical protein